jgi:hypothetical protein
MKTTMLLDDLDGSSTPDLVGKVLIADEPRDAGETLIRYHILEAIRKGAEVLVVGPEVVSDGSDSGRELAVSYGSNGVMDPASCLNVTFRRVIAGFNMLRRYAGLPPAELPYQINEGEFLARHLDRDYAISFKISPERDEPWQSLVLRVS